MKKGNIYKIISIEGPEFYVGSTLKTIRDRLRPISRILHKSSKGSDNLFCSCFRLFEKYAVICLWLIDVKLYRSKNTMLMILNS